ncbi:DNA-binding protein [Kistimonas scapharcae]|uniref:DNA-binding protein n=1 Tax=Kistimonas scapharcae TaxID=1036133 RepID=A0ABP8V3K0_9GAMM
MSGTEWFTAKELAGLPGLDGVARSVTRRAIRESWQSRPRKARGGGREYHIDSLPADTRRALRISQAKKAKTSPPNIVVDRQGLPSEAKESAFDGEADLKALSLLAGAARERQADRAAILMALADEEKQHSRKKDAIKSLVDSYNRRDIEPRNGIHRRIKQVNRSTLLRWRKSVAEQGWASLAGNYRPAKAGTGYFDRYPLAADLLLALLREYAHTKLSVLHKALLEALKGTDIQERPGRTATGRYINQWKARNPKLFLLLTNRDGYKNKYQAAVGSRSEHVLRLNQEWELDSTPADVMFTDGRFSLIGVIDIYTRRVRLEVRPSSTAAGIARVLRKAILDWGVPETCRTDQGNDYMSNLVRQALKSLSIDQVLCTPYSGEEKPHIERFFKTFSHDLVELLPGFIGHNVAERKALESCKTFAERLMLKDEVIQSSMSSQEFQGWADDWLENYYHDVPHSSLAGKSPNQMTREWQGNVRRIEDERALDLLLSPLTARKVLKKGIKHNGRWFDAPELFALMTPNVQIREDESDLGILYVFDQDGGFLCTAVDRDLLGLSRQEAATETRQRQKAAEREALEAAKEVRKRHKTDVRSVALDMVRRRERGNVADFPRPAENHSNSHISGASAAMDARENIGKPDTRVNDVPDYMRPGAGHIEQLVREKDNPLEETMYDRMRRWILLEERVQADQPLADTDQAWKNRFETSSEYRGMKMIYDIDGRKAFFVEQREQDKSAARDKAAGN